jgi:hypothetical protein
MDDFSQTVQAQMTNDTSPTNNSVQFLKRLLGAALLSLVGQFLHVACAADDDQDLARSILDKSDQIRFPREGFQVEVKIDTAVAGQPAEVRKYRVLSKDNENTVVMVTEPAAERGQTMLGKPRPTRLVMEDALRKDEESVLEYSEMKLRDRPDKLFTKDYLNKLE